MLATWLAVASTAGFSSLCSSLSDYGWPRFATMAEAEADSSWSAYFMEVYGELPTEFPACVYDLDNLLAGAFNASGLAERYMDRLVPSESVKEGDLFIDLFGNFHIYHGQWAPAPNNSWIEVARVVVPTEYSCAWAWNAPGSGVWFNVGRTIVFPTPSDQSELHAAAIEYLTQGCSAWQGWSAWPAVENVIFGDCAREKGIDSIQFEPQQGQSPTGTFNITGVTELVMVNVLGNYTCGAADASASPLRVGWAASEACTCENQPIDPTCGLMPDCPPTMPLGCTPPICEAAAQGQPCNPATCVAYSPQMCREPSDALRRSHPPAERRHELVGPGAAAAAARAATLAALAI